MGDRGVVRWSNIGCTRKGGICNLEITKQRRRCVSKIEKITRRHMYIVRNGPLEIICMFCNLISVNYGKISFFRHLRHEELKLSLHSAIMPQIDKEENVLKLIVKWDIYLLNTSHIPGSIPLNSKFFWKNVLTVSLYKEEQQRYLFLTIYLFLA